MFLWSLMFCNQAGLYTFDMFDTYSGHIQLWFCVVLQLIIIPWMFGMDKLQVLLTERTGEKMPMAFVWMVKTFCPFIVFVVFILTFVGDFSSDTAASRLEKNGWTPGITWAGRLMWIIPLVIIGVGACFPIQTENIYDLIEKQYGIKFAEDGTHTKVAPK